MDTKKHQVRPRGELSEEMTEANRTHSFPRKPRGRSVQRYSGLPSTARTKNGHSATSCGLLVAMLTKAKGSLFLGLLEWQIVGRSEVVRPVTDVSISWHSAQTTKALHSGTPILDLGGF